MISGKVITLTTQDISKISSGFHFQLDQPVQLGSLKDFLTWAKSKIPNFPSDINPDSWPAPFDKLALMVVTVNDFCIDNTVSPAVYLVDISMVASDPPPVIPVLDIPIVGFGVKVSKGQCKESTPQLFGSAPALG